MRRLSLEQRVCEEKTKFFADRQVSRREPEVHKAEGGGQGEALG